jgi:hypothetical protein
VRDLLISRFGLSILLQPNMWTNPGIIEIAHRVILNVEIGTEAAQFPELQKMSPDAQAMNGSVVSSVTDKFGFMCGEGDETDQRTEQERETNTASGSLHTDLEILR